MLRSPAVFLFLAIAGVAYPGAARAEVIDTNITIAAPTIDITFAQAQAGVTGYFDVILTDTAAETLAQFQASLTLAGPGTNVSIVGADLGQVSNGETSSPRAVADGIGDAVNASPNLIDPYVLGNVYATVNSGDVVNGGWVYHDSTDADNSDGTNTGTVSLSPNTAYSLEQVYFQIQPGTAEGIYGLTFDTNAPYNDLPGQTGNDPLGDFVNLVSNANLTSYEGTNVISGAIVITPEPGSVVLMLLGVIGLLGHGWRRRRAA